MRCTGTPARTEGMGARFLLRAHHKQFCTKIIKSLEKCRRGSCPAFPQCRRPWPCSCRIYTICVLLHDVHCSRLSFQSKIYRTFLILSNRFLFRETWWPKEKLWRLFLVGDVQWLTLLLANSIAVFSQCWNPGRYWSIWKYTYKFWIFMLWLLLGMLWGKQTTLIWLL